MRNCFASKARALWVSFLNPNLKWTVLAITVFIVSSTVQGKWDQVEVYCWSLLPWKWCTDTCSCDTLFDPQTQVWAYPPSFSKMRVDLAAQVLHYLRDYCEIWYYLILILFLYFRFSVTVSKALEMTGGKDAQETAKFVGMLDKFFDCLNVNSFIKGKHSRKAFQTDTNQQPIFAWRYCIVLS